MRISGEQSNLATRVGSVSGVSAPSTTTGSGDASTSIETSAATVSFSSQAQQISNAKAAVNSVPDVREDLVNSLKAKIDSGTYNVSSSDIADMMLRRHDADTAK